MTSTRKQSCNWLRSLLNGTRKLLADWWVPIGGMALLICPSFNLFCRMIFRSC